MPASSTPVPLPLEELEGVARRVAGKGKRGVRKAKSKLDGLKEKFNDGSGTIDPPPSQGGSTGSASLLPAVDERGDGREGPRSEVARGARSEPQLSAEKPPPREPSAKKSAAAPQTSGAKDRRDGAPGKASRSEVAEGRAKSRARLLPAAKPLPREPSAKKLLAAAPNASGATNDRSDGARRTSLAEHNHRTGMSGMQLMLTLYAAFFSAHHVWTRRSEILANRCPLSVVFVLVVGAFVAGYAAAASSSPPEGGGDARGGRGSFLGEKMRTSLRQLGGIARAADVQEGEEEEKGEEREDEEEEDEEGDSARGFSRTRALARRGKRRLKHFTRRYKSALAADLAELGDRDRSGFWSDLRRPKEEAKEWERRLRAPFAEGPLMDHLLGRSDFRRHVSRKRMVKAGGGVKAESPGGERRASAVGKEGEAKGGDEREDGSKAESFGTADISLGNAEMKNTRAEMLEGDEQFSHKVDPLCELRGMDMFLTDDPEEEIWRQPLLIKSGLRDVPTFIANMMFPFGNMTAYFKLPDWFDDWDNIPEEKDDDPPDIKALKRFLAGDEEYRKARCKIIPYVVDGPLAVQLIKPKPVEVTLDGPRHPNRWHQVPKCKARGQAAILECDIDVGLSNKKVRKILNIIRPHIESVTIDVALIVDTLTHQEEEEPSACLGLWRIEKVDFESAAVFPELPVEDACETVKLIMSTMEMEDVDIAT